MLDPPLPDSRPIAVQQPYIYIYIYIFLVPGLICWVSGLEFRMKVFRCGARVHECQGLRKPYDRTYDNHMQGAGHMQIAWQDICTSYEHTSETNMNYAKSYVHILSSVHINKAFRYWLNHSWLIFSCANLLS